MGILLLRLYYDDDLLCSPYIVWWMSNYLWVYTVFESSIHAYHVLLSDNDMKSQIHPSDMKADRLSSSFHQFIISIPFNIFSLLHVVKGKVSGTLLVMLYKDNNQILGHLN